MKLGEIATKLGLELRGDGELEIAMPAPIETAAAGMITFAVGPKYAAALREAAHLQRSSPQNSPAKPAAR